MAMFLGKRNESINSCWICVSYFHVLNVGIRHISKLTHISVVIYRNFILMYFYDIFVSIIVHI